MPFERFYALTTYYREEYVKAHDGYTEEDFLLEFGDRNRWGRMVKFKGQGAYRKDMLRSCFLFELDEWEACDFLSTADQAFNMGDPREKVMYECLKRSIHDPKAVNAILKGKGYKPLFTYSWEKNEPEQIDAYEAKRRALLVEGFDEGRSAEEINQKFIENRYGKWEGLSHVIPRAAYESGKKRDEILIKCLNQGIIYGKDEINVILEGNGCKALFTYPWCMGKKYIKIDEDSESGEEIVENKESKRDELLIKCFNEGKNIDEINSIFEKEKYETIPVSPDKNQQTYTKDEQRDILLIYCITRGICDKDVIDKILSASGLKELGAEFEEDGGQEGR